MSVIDNGIEALRKACIPLTPGNLAEYIIRIATTPEYPLDFSGTVSFSGFKNGFRISTIEVGDTAVLLPMISLNDRNSLVLTNKSLTETLYVGNFDVTADTVVGTTSGHEIPPGESFNVDFAGPILIYGRAETGKTIMIKILEMA